jgi:lysophospholipase L1-like esterase
MNTTRSIHVVGKGFISAIVVTLLIAVAGLRSPYSASTASGQAAATSPAKVQDWEPTIRKFEESDRTNPPKPGGIVFTGSSSIVRWRTLEDDMQPLEVVNRGFGGSQFSDLVQYTKRIVNVYQPRAVVVYEGDNDLAPGSPKTPEMIANDFKQFVQIVRSDLPDTWIYIVSIKPSTLRWSTWPQMKAANELMKDYSKTQRRVQYIDVATPMFAPDGTLPRDLFVVDGLHPTPKLYAMWTAIIKPVLLERFGPASKMSGKTLSAPAELLSAADGPRDSRSWNDRRVALAQ